MLGPQQLQHAVNLRHQGCTIRRITKVVGYPLSTVARAMKALGLGRLRNLEPKRLRFCEAVALGTAVPMGEPGRHDSCRHQTAGPVRTGRPPHTGDRRQGCSRGAGYEKVHVAIDDATRLAYVEVLPDEQKATTVGFLARAVGWFSQQGITEVGAFYWTVLAPDIVNPGREEQDSVSV